MNTMIIVCEIPTNFTFEKHLDSVIYFNMKRKKKP